MKTNLFFIPLKWWRLINSLVVFSSIIGCTTNQHNKELVQQVFIQNTIYLIIPLEDSCDGCVSKVLDFVRENTTQIKKSPD